MIIYDIVPPSHIQKPIIQKSIIQKPAVKKRKKSTAISKRIMSFLLILSFIIQATISAFTPIEFSYRFSYLAAPQKAQAVSGSWAQTDWTGGAGQSTWSDTTKYSAVTGEGVYNTTDLRMKINADAVVGQPNLTSGRANQVEGPGKETLYSPYNAYTDGTRLFIADYSNNRVLIYNTIPIANNAPADVVVGQANFVSVSANQRGSRAANTLNGPINVSSDGTRLFIADYGNHRVLIYNTIPTSNNTPADVVVGQPDFTSGSANQGGANPAANTLYNPYSAYTDGTRLFISDYNNHRVLIYNTIPTSNNASANIVVGQTTFTTRVANQGGRAANTLSGPLHASSDGTRLFIADYGNHRVLIYNTIPVINKPSADIVVGQANFTSGSANQGGANPAANTLYNPYSVYTDGTRLFISDYSNHRVLIYNTIPIANNTSADIAVGQANFTSGSANQGGVRTANTLNNPSHALASGSRLFIADRANQRVLIYSTIPASNNASADVVVGQTNFANGNVNQTGSLPTASTLKNPYGVNINNGKVFIADTFNNRVLIYNTIPSSSNAPADVVIGQPDFVSASANQGGSRGANTLNTPVHAFSVGTRLFIADTYNHRVLIYNTIPDSNNASADIVIGQTDFTGGSANRGGSSAANTLNKPFSVYTVMAQDFLLRMILTIVS